MNGCVWNACEEPHYVGPYLGPEIDSKSVFKQVAAVLSERTLLAKGLDPLDPPALRELHDLLPQVFPSSYFYAMRREWGTRAEAECVSEIVSMVMESLMRRLRQRGARA